MALSKMLHFTAVTMKDDTEDLYRELQLLGCADLIKNDYDTEEGFSPSEYTEILSDISQKISKAYSAESFLARYSEKSKKLFQAPEEIKLRSLENGFSDKADKFAAEILELQRELNVLKSETQSLENEMEALSPWRDIKAEIPYSFTSRTKSVSGTIPIKTSTEKINSLLSDRFAVVETLKKTEKTRYVRMTTLKETFDDSYAVLSESGFTVFPYSAKESEGFAEGRYSMLLLKNKGASSRIDEIENELKKYSVKIKDIEVYIDYLSTEKARYEAMELSCVSGSTSVISGWVPEENEKSLSALFIDRGGAFESQPAGPEREDAPIKFKNNRFASNFEQVVELYSPPAYGSYDPTPVMSVFYFLIFGLMLADVAYGIILFAGCLAGLKLLHPKGSTKKMITMFMLCGISCTIMGVLFGGYFSDLPKVIMQNWFGIPDPRPLALLFDPLESPVFFLVISLAVGAVHLMTGLVIKFCIMWKRKKRFEAVFDTGSWIILFIGLGVMFVFMPAGLALTGAGVLMLVLTQGRDSKNPVMKLLKGIMSLYDIVNYFSDLLSYSRILALGLASMVVGSVFNILGTLPGLSVAGVLVFFVIFAFGHVLNLGVNLLGTFVHTSRLQYIEFFGKFYEDGGRMFTPLKPVSKYVILK